MSFGSHIAGRYHVELHLAILIECWAYLNLDILVDANLGIEHALTNVEVLFVAFVVQTFYQGNFEQVHLAEELLAILVKLAEVGHTTVHVNQFTILVIERHGYQAILEHVLVFAGYLFVHALLLYLVGVIPERGNDVTWLVFVVFYYGMSLNPMPVGLFYRSSVITTLQIAQILMTLTH